MEKLSETKLLTILIKTLIQIAKKEARTKFCWDAYWFYFKLENRGNLFCAYGFIEIAPSTMHDSKAHSLCLQKQQKLLSQNNKNIRTQNNL